MRKWRKKGEGKMKGREGGKEEIGREWREKRMELKEGKVKGRKMWVCERRCGGKWKDRKRGGKVDPRKGREGRERG